MIVLFKKKRKWEWGIMLLVLFCGFALTGCQPEGKEETEKASTISGNVAETKGDRLQVVTTIFPYYDFARQIAGEYADVTMIIPAGMDTHSFEPTAADMIEIGKADVFIYNGGEMETWVPKVIDASGNDKLFADSMIDYVETFAEEHVEGMKQEKGHDHEQIDDDTHGADKADEQHGHGEELDEHIWTSPENAQKIVAQIAKDLAKADVKHKDQYLDNAQTYMKELEKIDKQFEEIVSQAKNHYLVFADRFPLRYFVEEYDLEYTAAFAGCSSETEPSADTLAYLTDQVKKYHLPVVLKIELTSSRVADIIAETTGARVETFSTCHNVTKEQLEKGETYLSLMEKNISVLKDALEVKS